jgi:hypothetical protein
MINIAYKKYERLGLKCSNSGIDPARSHGDLVMVQDICICQLSALSLEVSYDSKALFSYSAVNFTMILLSHFISIIKY